MTITFVELNGSVRNIKKQNAKKLINSGAYEQLKPRLWRAIERRREARGLEVVTRQIIFEYDYPCQILHPELALIPAMRYPVDIARQGLTSFTQV